MEWLEDGIEQRVYLVIDVDDTHWWIDYIWVDDGAKSGDWIVREPRERDPHAARGEPDRRPRGQEHERRPPEVRRAGHRDPAV